MDKVGAYAERDEQFRNRLNSVFLIGKVSPLSLRKWIADDVLLEYTTYLNRDKKCISESVFICMIQDLWCRAIKDYSMRIFQSDFEKVQEIIRKERTATTTATTEMAASSSASVAEEEV